MDQHKTVWVVGRFNGPSWDLQGIFDDEGKAGSICVDETYFIGPIPVNTALPYETICWTGCYHPLAR